MSLLPASPLHQPSRPRHVVLTRHRSTLITNYQFPGTYDSEELELFWEPDDPITVNRDLQLSEYRLVNLHSNFTIANYSLRSERSTSLNLNSRAQGKFGE
jgi:hypothetical protein